MTACCPLCGADYKSDDLILLPERNLVCRGELQVFLPGRQWDVFLRLYAASPRVVRRDVLLDSIYGLENEAPDIKIIDVFVCRLRRLLKPFGVRIHTQWGTGFRLDFDGTARVFEKAVAA